MSDIRHQDRLHNRPKQPRELTILRKSQENRGESKAMLAIIAAGIAGLCLVAIIAAFQFISSPDTALRDNPPASASAPATRLPPETTGSGSSLPPETQAPDKSIKQQ